ncbi:hypothetical protein PV325_013566 [Microctonus aethiopoides]|nr:hypothetical protein PV325_013566 [Microctonus aethiopoides]
MKVEAKRGPGRPRKNEQEKGDAYGSILSFVDMRDRGGNRPRVVHSPPRKEQGGRCDDTNGSGCVEGTEDTVGKSGGEGNKDYEADDEENRGNKEKGRGEQSEKMRAENEEGEKSNSEGEEGEEEGSESYEREKDGVKEWGKRSPSAGEIERMLIKERIKVLECEVVRMRENEVLKRMEALEKEVMKIRKENEEERKMWRREKKELEDKIRRCEREIENRIMKTPRGERGEGADEMNETEEGGRKEKGGEGENREEIRRSKSYRSALKGRRGEEEAERNEKKREGDKMIKQNKRKEDEDEEREVNMEVIQKRGWGGRREEERETGRIGHMDRGRPY